MTPGIDARRPSLRPSRRLVAAGALGGLATSSGVALTATSGWLIVRAADMPIILTLMVAIVAVRTFGIARPALRYGERLVAHDDSLATLAERRTDLFRRLIPLTPARLGTGPRSAILGGVVDDLTEEVESGVRVTVPILGSLVAGAIGTALAGWVLPGAAAIVATLLFLVAAVVAAGAALESRSQDALVRARADTLNVADLVASHADDLRAIGAGDQALRWLDDAHREQRRASRVQSRGRAFVGAAILVVTAGATIAMADLVTSTDLGAPLQALLIVLPIAMGDAFAPLVDVARAWPRARASSRRLDALLARTPAIHEGGDEAVAAPVCLDADGVTTSWEPGRTALGPVSARLRPGERVAVLGPTGSGKSTLVAVLARHLDPESGTYAINERPAAGTSLAAARGLFAIVEDEPHLFASNVRENLRLARPDADDDELVDALARAGLGDWLGGLDEGLDTDIGSGARGVSGGERARLALARAYTSGRPVFLMDEPFAHLDHATAASLVDEVVSQEGEHSLVLVTHDPEWVDGFDRVLEIEAPRHL